MDISSGLCGGYSMRRNSIAHFLIKGELVYHNEGIINADSSLFYIMKRYDQGGETIYNGQSLRWRRESPGTVVFVRDVFFNVQLFLPLIAGMMLIVLPSASYSSSVSSFSSTDS